MQKTISKVALPGAPTGLNKHCMMTFKESFTTDGLNVNGNGGGGSGAAKQTFQNVKKKEKEKIQGQQPPAATAFHPKLRLKIIAARSSQRRLSRSSTEKFAREISPWPSV